MFLSPEARLAAPTSLAPGEQRPGEGPGGSARSGCSPCPGTRGCRVRSRRKLPKGLGNNHLFSHLLPLQFALMIFLKVGNMWIFFFSLCLEFL